MDLITNIGEKLEELGFSESILDFSDDYIITDEDFDFDFED